MGVLALGCMIVSSMAQRAAGLARDGVGQEMNQVKDQLRNAESGISAPKVPTLAPDAIQQLQDEAEAELEEGLDEAAETSEDLSDAVAEDAAVDSAVEEATTAVEDATEDAGEAMDAAAAEPQEAVTEATEAVADAAEDAEDAVPDAVEETADAAEEIVAEVEETVEAAEEAVGMPMKGEEIAEVPVVAGEADVEGETPVGEDTATTTEEEAEPDAEMAADDATDTSEEIEPGEGEEEESSTRRRRGRRRRSDSGAKYEITKLTLTGDKDLLEELDLTATLESRIVGEELSRFDIDGVARYINKLVLEEGFYLARIQSKSASRELAEGEAVIDVDKGRVGEASFYEMDGEERIPYRGRWYSEKQLRLRMQGLESEQTFRYDDFYKNVFNVNSHPDLTMDTDLSVRKERKDGRQVRYVDMDFIVDDKLPLHGVLEFRNTGTDATENWRAGLTLQHLNLTKHDDVLTVTLPMSIPFGTIASVAASYYLPHHVGHGGALTTFGGYSKLESTDIVTDVDLDGEGLFGGLQVSYGLLDTENHSISISGGYTYQLIEDTLILGQALETPREVAIAPLNFVFTYSSVRPDRFGGRNFLTAQSNLNIGGALGSDGDEEFSLQRETAESDYFVQRLQYARIQPLAFREPDPDLAGKQWIMFLKADGQFASGALVPAEMKGVGGMMTVRGYEEREILGDNGLSGSIEFRSPIWTGNLFKKWARYPDAVGGTERLQFVGFIDGAIALLEDTPAAEKDQFELLSVGLGFRLALTKYMQLRFDWGFPIEETEASDTSGRGHIAIEFQI